MKSYIYIYIYIRFSLISGFCLGKYGNTSYNAFYVQNTSLFNSYRHKKKHKNTDKNTFSISFHK